MQKLIIENYIPVGYENRISRAGLCAKVKCTDRDVRNAIEASNEPIISIDGGYFIPGDGEEHLARQYYNQERARMRSIMHKLKKFRRYVE